MRARARLAGLVLGALLAAGCSGGPDCVLVEVRWQGYRVPADLDTLHFALADADGPFVERSLAIPADAPPATLELCRGPRTPASLQLVVHGLHAGLEVVQADPVTIDYAAGPAEVTVQLP